MYILAACGCAKPAHILLYLIALVSWVANPGAGVTPRKIGLGCGAHSPKPLPFYDQNLRFFLPYLRPNQEFDDLFMTVVAGTVVLNIIYERLWLMISSIMKKR